MTSAKKREAPETLDRVDFSPAAVDQRLDEVAQLYELGVYLAQAKPTAPSRPDTWRQEPSSEGERDR